MKGIYLTEEGRQEIESRIAELEKYNYEDEKLNGDLEGHIYALKEILSSAIILPIEENWYDVSKSVVFENIYPNGVVIQPK